MDVIKAFLHYQSKVGSVLSPTINTTIYLYLLLRKSAQTGKEKKKPRKSGSITFPNSKVLWGCSIYPNRSHAKVHGNYWERLCGNRHNMWGCFKFFFFCLLLIWLVHIPPAKKKLCRFIKLPWRKCIVRTSGLDSHYFSNPVLVHMNMVSHLQ